MTKTERQEYIMYVQSMYDEYLMKTENRNMSYGELAYIEGLKKKELDNLLEEILEELESEDEK